MIMVTREDLYQAVWAEPLNKLAERFKVSGSYLARVCDSLRVPRPDRGYWAKKEVGKAPPITPLSPAQPGDPTEWSSGNGVAIRRSTPRDVVVMSERKTKAVQTHALLSGAVGHFSHGRRPADESGYIKPYKRYLLDVTCSKAALARALEFANVLFLALEAKGHRVGISGGQSGLLRRPDVDPLEKPAERVGYSPHNLWVPGRLTIAHVGGQMVGLSIVEIAEVTAMRYVGNSTYVPETEYTAQRSRHRRYAGHTWTTTQERPSGRLRLIAYAPHYRVELTRHWQEDNGSRIGAGLSAIVSGIESMAAEIARLVAEAERKLEVERREYEAQRRRYQIEENERRIRESVKQSHDQLEGIIRQWADTRAKSEFLDGLEREIDALPEADREQMNTRIVMARSLLGSTDPMSHFRAWRAPAERYMPKCFEEEGH